MPFAWAGPAWQPPRRAHGQRTSDVGVAAARCERKEQAARTQAASVRGVARGALHAWPVAQAWGEAWSLECLLQA